MMSLSGSCSRLAASERDRQSFIGTSMGCLHRSGFCCSISCTHLAMTLSARVFYYLAKDGGPSRSDCRVIFSHNGTVRPELRHESRFGEAFVFCGGCGGE